MFKSNPAAVELSWHQRTLLAVLSWLVRCWGRTLRFHFKDDVQRVLDAKIPPLVLVIWHNRLFAAPFFYRRYFGKRQLATLISASGDGAWLAGFLVKLGMRPVRGSRYKRGAQAVRELITAQQEGFDVGVTPDGSRGPIYDMKAGAVAVALKTGAPVVLISFNFSRAWRLNSWDRFFIPYPFSRIEVRMDAVEQSSDLGDDSREAAIRLKERMDAITGDK